MSTWDLVDVGAYDCCDRCGHYARAHRDRHGWRHDCRGVWIDGTQCPCDSFEIQR